ncbi:MAG TPA: BTAD domain-containing putative transcriptional regulator [Gemmatimonadaceae bacterium]|nr:BTAD domain-containing putative transcriptional regulator [Gemmatimonadaceae bacterium]
MIDFRMLGQIRLRSADGTDFDALLRQPKRLALLAYLASPAPGTWHRRDILLALFWPELDTTHARTSLRTGIYVLRQNLGEEIIRNRGDEEISVDPGRLHTDVAAVWDALRAKDFDDALKHYDGDLLPGLFPSDSEGFQRWLESERLRLKVAVSSSAVDRINTLEREGKLEQAIGVARRVIEIQPDDESLIRRVMSLHEANGDRAGGLALFESYRARLASDFEAQPAPETVALAARLRSATAIPVKRPSTTIHAAPQNVRHEPQYDEPPPHVAGEAPKVPQPSRTKWLMAAGLLAVILVAGVMALRMSGSDRPLSIARSMPLTLEEGLQVEPAISPNGRLVAYAKGNSSQFRIFVQRIGGGAAWALTPDSSEIQLMPRWSPDNDEILFLAKNSAYASPSLGGTPRLIANGTEGEGMVRSAAWSPSGDSIAFVRRDSLFAKPADGAGARFVGKAYQLHSCVWSPNGKWIACVSGNVLAFTPGPLFGNEAPSAIVLFPAAGGNGVDLTGNAYEHKSPAWSADGNFLWMVSNRDGVPGEAYAIRIASDGASDRKLTRLGFNTEWISLSNARVAYSVPVRKGNIWSVPIPHDSSVTLSAAKPVTTGTQLIELVAVSPDGKWLLYDNNRRGNADIYRMPRDGGTPEQLTTDAAPEYAGELSPNGEELAWHRWVNGKRTLFVKRLDSDGEQEITSVTEDAGVPRWSPDGKSLAAWTHNKEEGGVFVLRRDTNGTWSKPVWHLDRGQLPVWSPDGRTLAFVLLDGSVQTIPVDSGPLRAVYTPREKTDPIATQLSWRDDMQIWFLGQDSTGRGGVWTLPLRANARPRLLVRFDIPAGASYGPALASDGSRFYFTLNEHFSNVRWAELTGR